MLKPITIIILLIFLQACKDLKTIKFFTTENGKKIVYITKVPKGYKVKKVIDDHGYKEIRLVYPEGAIFYVTNDFKSGGAINKAKVRKYGKDIYLKILTNNFLNLKGTDNGNYWREVKKNKVVVGYINADLNKKEKFDAAIAHLKRYINE